MKFSFSSKAPETFPKDVLRIALVPKSEEVHYFRDAKGAAHLSVGIKDVSKINRRKAMLVIRRLVREARARKAVKAALLFPEGSFPKAELSGKELGRVFAENAVMANYEYDTYKTKKKYSGLRELVLCGAGKEEQKGISIGTKVGEAINAARDLSNTPGGDMTPSVLARAAKDAARGTKASVKVLGKKEMERLGMGAVLGVAKGATEEPKFIIVEYWGAAKSHKPVVLVGKGITFDSGGLNLKPSDYILDMHLDMSGGAAVLMSVVLAAALSLRVNVVALIPAAENMVSGESYRPGDVLRSLSGKTIEVVDTDAEGRLVLADGLAYAKRYNPAYVLDVATLTGGALVVLGNQGSVIMTRDEELERTLRNLGETSGDYVWPLPLWEEFEKGVKGQCADIANLPLENKRLAQCIMGGMFLREFTNGTRWAHIDIAPRMTAAPGEYLAKGAAGAPVRLLIRFLEQQAGHLL